MGKDTELVTPGEKLGRASEFKAGRGAYVSPDHLTVYASLTGFRRILSPPSNSPDQRPTVEVTGHKAHGAIPEPGSIVIARVTKVMARMASADIMCLGTKSVRENFTGIIRLQDIRATEIDKVDMHLSFRPGDIVRAIVLSLGDARAYFLSTAKNELGVISAQSAAGAPMVAISWTEMQCPITGQIEHRKVAKNIMGARWKGKGSKAKALADPMSKIVLQLQSSLIQSNSEGLLCGCSVLLSVEAEQADLLNRSCFGEPMITTEKDNQWFELSMEEAFYLCYALKCLNIVEDQCPKSDDQLWQCMKSRSALFPYLYKAYSHLRMKNWVVMSGITYGADFVAYRHHPELVHSEYAVIVSSEEEGDANKRLRVWSDVHCATRLCGGVAKTLLVLDISKNGHSADSPSCLESYTVKERTITRWNPEQCREDHTKVESENVAKVEM